MGTDAGAGIGSGADRHNSVGDSSDGKNRSLRRNDDRSECTTPNMPRLLIVNVPPAMSAGRSFSGTRAFCQLVALQRNFAQRRLVSMVDHGRHQRHRLPRSPVQR